MGDIVELCMHEMTRQFCSYCKDRPPAESRNARLWNHPGEGYDHHQHPPPASTTRASPPPTSPPP